MKIDLTKDYLMKLFEISKVLNCDSQKVIEIMIDDRYRELEKTGLIEINPLEEVEKLFNELFPDYEIDNYQSGLFLSGGNNDLMVTLENIKYCKTNKFKNGGIESQEHLYKYIYCAIRDNYAGVKILSDVEKLERKLLGLDK